jgi:hypothetical protein
VVVGGGRMKFNKLEMALLAGQPGHRYRKSLIKKNFREAVCGGAASIFIRLLASKNEAIPTPAFPHQIRGQIFEIDTNLKQLTYELNIS